MRFAPFALLAALAMPSAALAQVDPTPPPPATTTPGQTVPGQPPGPTATPATPPIPPLATRSFSTKTGLFFQAVRPERVADYETVIGLFKDALERSPDPTVRAQAAGWDVFKATEPGPNGTALYVFVIDPAVPGADYGLGRILADAYPEKINEIWTLYTGALSGGGSLLNLTPFDALTPAPAVPSPVPPPVGTPSPAARP